MRKIKLSGLLVGLCLIFAVTQDSFADRRSYVWTYEYMTMPAGMWELEYYLTTEVPNINKSNINTLKQWLELEYGITDNWDVAMYQMWKFNNKRFENDSEYDGFKIRTRYKFGKKGQFIVDPLLYLEYIRDDDFSKPNVVEAKLILAKDLGNLNASYNQIIKRNLEREGKTDHEYATGLNYAFFSAFKFGIESKGNYSKEKFAIGPTLSFSTRKLWVSLGAAFGLNKRTDDVQTRMIVGVPF
ncbi:MAG: hypothetical protein Q8N72_03800 [Candidatus Omnitrophota bacterium]|nr:hypothetical protein [Candidatus Omnitrophota bacterium]